MPRGWIQVEQATLALLLMLMISDFVKKIFFLLALPLKAD
jgi:hypothetical protein